MARNEFGPHYGCCGWVPGSFELRSCDFGAASGIDLLSVRSLFSLFSLDLAEFATGEIIAPSQKWYLVSVGRMMQTYNLANPHAKMPA